LINSCAPKVITKVEYREVKIPVKCSADVPRRPQYIGSPVDGVLTLMEYCEKLEALIKVCVESPEAK
jgi:hypothetical protein